MAYPYFGAYPFSGLRGPRHQTLCGFLPFETQPAAAPLGEVIFDVQLQ
jgi:hypothetical protein